MLWLDSSVYRNEAMEIMKKKLEHIIDGAKWRKFPNWSGNKIVFITNEISEKRLPNGLNVFYVLEETYFPGLLPVPNATKLMDIPPRHVHLTRLIGYVLSVPLRIMYGGIVNRVELMIILGPSFFLWNVRFVKSFSELSGIIVPVIQRLPVSYLHQMLGWFYKYL